MSHFKKKIHTVIGRHFTDATRVIIVIIVLQLQDKKNTITAITIYWLSFCWWGNLEKQFWKQVWYANSDISDFSGKRDLLFLRDEGASRYEEVKILLGKGCRSLFYTHTHTHTHSPSYTHIQLLPYRLLFSHRDYIQKQFMEKKKTMSQQRTGHGVHLNHL